MRWVADPRDSVRAFGLLYGAVGLGALALVRFAAGPLRPWLACPLYSATGIPCPGCGGTHAALALAQGQVALAARTNALVTCGLLAWIAWAAFALVATAAPALRVRPVLGRRERIAVRALAVAAVTAQWAWLLVHRGV